MPLLFKGNDNVDHIYEYLDWKYPEYARVQQDGEREVVIDDEHIQEKLPNVQLNGLLSWSATFVYDFLLNGVQDIYTIPIKNAVVEEYGQVFIEKMPYMRWLMSHYKRYKVARSYLILFGAFDRYRTTRPDILRFYLSNACSFNDLFIELFNSLVNRALPQNMTIATSDITNASARVVIKHSMLKA